MPFANLAVSPFPDVPALPGVPPLNTLPSVAGVSSLSGIITGLGGGPIIAVADELGLGSLFGVPTWGLFDDSGNPVLTGDCVAEVGYRRDYKISDYPVEDGGFASYNKVQIPSVANIVFMVGGSNADRATFLAQAEAVAQSLTLYSVATPEITYTSANVTGFAYHRTSRQGATLLRVEMTVEEVRIAGSPQFTNSNTAQPDGATAQNGGVAPTTAVTSTSLPAATSTGRFAGPV